MTQKMILCRWDLLHKQLYDCWGNCFIIWKHIACCKFQLNLDGRFRIKEWFSSLYLSWFFIFILILFLFICFGNTNFNRLNCFNLTITGKIKFNLPFYSCLHATKNTEILPLVHQYDHEASHLQLHHFRQMKSKKISVNIDKP